jgi:hypothetical protein
MTKKIIAGGWLIGLTCSLFYIKGGFAALMAALLAAAVFVSILVAIAILVDAL